MFCCKNGKQIAWAFTFTLTLQTSSIEFVYTEIKSIILNEVIVLSFHLPQHQQNITQMVFVSSVSTVKGKSVIGMRFKCLAWANQNDETMMQSIFMPKSSQFLCHHSFIWYFAIEWCVLSIYPMRKYEKLETIAGAPCVLMCLINS